MSTFVLMENWQTKSIQEMPELGAGLLLAVLKQNHTQTQLLPGQTKFLKHLFIDDTEELLFLFRELDKPTLEKFNVSQEIQTIDVDEIKTKLKNLYDTCINKKSARDYLNQILYQELNKWMEYLIKIQRYFLVEKEHQDIPLIRRYKQAIRKMSPSVMGFSITLKENAFIKALRSFAAQEEIPCVVGGTHYAFYPQILYPKLMDLKSNTYYVVGPGEIALPQLLAALDGQGDMESIPNLVYWQNGQLKINRHELITNLDSLPDPDFTEFELEKYISPVRVLPFETSRGCYWRKCVFCYEYCIPGYFTYSAERIVNRFQDHIEKYDVHHYFSTDEHINPNLALEISDASIERDLDINIYALARLDPKFDDLETLTRLHSGGFKVIHWGLESASQRVLNSMGKGTRVSRIPDILSKAHQAGIQNFVFVMFGFPGETEAELNKTLAFLKKYDHLINQFDLGLFSLQFSTLIFQDRERWGIRLAPDSFEDEKKLIDKSLMFEFTTNTGIDRETMKKKYSQIVGKKRFNAILNYPDRVNLMVGTLGLRQYMYYFLLAFHGVFPRSKALATFSSGEVEQYYPLISGHLEEEKSQTFLQPIRFNETMLIHKTLPPKPIPITPLEKQIWTLANGTSSIQQILNQVHFSDLTFPKNEVREHVLTFLQKCIKEYWGILFKKQWQLSSHN